MTHPYVCVFTEGEAFRFSKVGGGEGAVPELPPPVPPLAGRAALSWKELQSPERLRVKGQRTGDLADWSLEAESQYEVRRSDALVGTCDEERDPVVGTGWLRRHILGRPW